MAEPMYYCGWTTRCNNCSRISSDQSPIDCPDQPAGKCDRFIDPGKPVPLRQDSTGAVVYDPAAYWGL